MEAIGVAFGINWKLMLVQAINFGLLLFVLNRFLYKPIMKIIDERKDKMTVGVARAIEAEEMLKTAESNSAEIQDRANQKAYALMNDTKREADDMRAKLLAKAEEDRSLISKEAQKEAEAIKQRTITEANAEIARLSVLAAEAVLRKRENI